MWPEYRTRWNISESLIHPWVQRYSTKCLAPYRLGYADVGGSAVRRQSIGKGDDVEKVERKYNAQCLHPLVSTVTHGSMDMATPGYSSSAPASCIDMQLTSSEQAGDDPKRPLRKGSMSMFHDRKSAGLGRATVDQAWFVVSSVWVPSLGVLFIAWEDLEACADASSAMPCW